MSQPIVVALIAVVTVLMMVQVPLDLRTHHLSRRATIRAAIAVAVIVAIDTWFAAALAALATSMLVVAAVMGVYGLLHRVSPHSLGWGDVLLVVPLTLAIAYVSVERVLWWQLMAALSGALHAGWIRVRHGRSHVPYGPHLLFAAWLVLAASV